MTVAAKGPNCIQLYTSLKNTEQKHTNLQMPMGLVSSFKCRYAGTGSCCVASPQCTSQAPASGAKASPR